jgi:hypothetical protein
MTMTEDERIAGEIAFQIDEMMDGKWHNETMMAAFALVIAKAYATPSENKTEADLVQNMKELSDYTVDVFQKLNEMIRDSTRMEH